MAVRLHTGHKSEHEVTWCIGWLTLPLHDGRGFDLNEDVGVKQGGYSEQR